MSSRGCFSSRRRWIWSSPLRHRLEQCSTGTTLAAVRPNRKPESPGGPPTSCAEVYVLSTDQQPLNRLRLVAPEPSSLRPLLFEPFFRFVAARAIFNHFVN